jgi:hypothetical protein
MPRRTSKNCSPTPHANAPGPSPHPVARADTLPGDRRGAQRACSLGPDIVAHQDPLDKHRAAGNVCCFELGTGKPALHRSGNCAPTSPTLRGARMDTCKRDAFASVMCRVQIRFARRARACSIRTRKAACKSTGFGALVGFWRTPRDVGGVESVARWPCGQNAQRKDASLAATDQSGCPRDARRGLPGLTAGMVRASYQR